MLGSRGRSGDARFTGAGGRSRACEDGGSSPCGRQVAQPQGQVGERGGDGAVAAPRTALLRFPGGEAPTILKVPGGWWPSLCTPACSMPLSRRGGHHAIPVRARPMPWRCGGCTSRARVLGVVRTASNGECTTIVVPQAAGGAHPIFPGLCGCSSEQVL